MIGLLLWALSAPPAEKGVALGLFSQDPQYRYTQLLQEVASTGATHVALTWVAWQDKLDSNEITAVPGWTATDAQISTAIQEAKRLGLHVTAFPILRLIHPGPGEWRGKIAPQNEDAWWRSYRDFILEAARLATENKADRLMVGSELLSRELDRVRWIDLIERVRLAAPGLELGYSANWDHFQVVSFWDQLDVVALTAYWELTKDPEASEVSLRFSWQAIKPLVQDFSVKLGRKLIFSEVGYPSLDGGAAWPWDETRKAPVDVEEQRRAYQAFVDVWSDTPELQGVYFWNWFGFGGPTDGNYTPRGKPAEMVLRKWYQRPSP